MVKMSLQEAKEYIKELEDAMESILQTHCISYAKEIAADALGVDPEEAYEDDDIVESLMFEDFG